MTVYNPKLNSWNLLNISIGFLMTAVEKISILDILKHQLNKFNLRHSPHNYLDFRKSVREPSFIGDEKY